VQTQQQQQAVIEPTLIDPEAVAAFFRRRAGTEALARRIVEILREEFSGIQSITWQAVKDPEEDAEWIRVQVNARMAPNDLHAAYRRYVTRATAEEAEARSDIGHFVRVSCRGV
jgi:hypothetical protein